MPRRGENIRFRKDGRWEGRVRLETSSGVKYKSVYGRTYRDVKQKMLTPIEASGMLNNVPFMKVADEWLKYKEVTQKGATIAKYDYLIERHIRPFFERITITSITPALINEFSLSKMKEGRMDGKGGLSSSYVRTMVIIICSVMEYAIANNLCDPLPKQTKKPVPEKKVINVLSRDQQQILEDYLLSDKSLTSLGILISLYTGLRIGEICALTWDDIDLNTNILHVKSTVSRIKKNGDDDGHSNIIDRPKTQSSVRDIPLPTKLQKQILDYKSSRKSKYVISESEYFVSPRTYEYRYHTALKACHLSSMNYHTLRHTFATRCIEVGMDVKTLSELLGHSNVSITLNTYVHSSIEMKRVQIEKLCK